jgi:hypothetical protein
MRYVVVALLLVGALSGVAIAQESPDIANATTTFDVELRADGGADWTVRTTVPLDTPEERDAFRSYGERFAAGETTAGPGIAFFESASAAASTAADREMEITNVERRYSLASDAGTLQLEFRWTNFLAAEGDDYRLADALMTGDGTWLRSLEAGQEIRLYTPPNYDIKQSIEARQVNDSLVVTGPETFDAEEFVVVYEPAERSPGTADSPTPNGPTPNEGGVDGIVVGVLGLLFLVVGVLAVWRWRGDEPIGAVAGDDDRPDESGNARTAVDDAETGPAEPVADTELLSDEERVETLLEQHGGRMRQAAIVEETDWSDAKVSQLLSRMADEGHIEKLRLGRENVISLPGDEET